MGKTIEETIKIILARMELRFIQDERVGIFVVPVSLSYSELLLVHIQPDEEAREVMLEIELCGVPPRRRSAVALELADLNHRIKFVTFSLGKSSAHADICVELAFTADIEPHITLALSRLLTAVSDCRADIVAIAEAQHRRCGRVEYEIEEILREHE